jgi:NAD(P)-dependent dehydrogenase (short-subunit alcohol dehydrogenase family)
LEAGGIGFSIAESFAKASVEHLILIQRRQEVLDKAKKELASRYQSTEVSTYTASITDFERISSILKEIGHIDILVPNVATSHPFIPSGEVSTVDFQMTFRTNVVATFHVIKEFLALKSSGPRVVINVSSATGQMVQPRNIGYGPSKAAINQIIQHFAVEYANEDVTFQTYHPGVIYTKGSSRVAAADAFE